MKILISCGATPYFITGGYSIQLDKILDCLYDHNPNIEFGFICWIKDIVPFLYKNKISYTFDDIKSIFDNSIYKTCYLTDVQNIKIYENSTFYIAETNNHWGYIDTINKHFQCNKLFIYQDIWPFKKYKIENIKCKKYLYMPIHDHFLPHKLLNFNNNINKHVNILHQLPYFDKISTCSKFGIEVLNMYNYKAIFINHIISENTINYITEPTNHSFKNVNFICLIIARNTCPTDRKGFIEQLTGFSIFLNKLSKDEKEKCRLIIHNNHNHSLKGSIDLEKIVTQKKIKKNIILTDVTIKTKKNIIELYTISDVLLNASKSEGFGMPIIESQLNGTPVITTNCTSMATNTFYGICTEPKEVSYVVNGINSWSNPSPKNIAEAITYFYNKKNKITNNLDLKYTLTPINKNLYNKKIISKKWIKFFDI